MSEISTLISPKEQKNVSEVSRPTRSFRSSDASQSSSLPLCQQFNKKERKEERKWEQNLEKSLLITEVRVLLFCFRDSAVRAKVRTR
jgi:hypothetical protein